MALLVALPVALIASELVLQADDVVTRLKSGEAARLWERMLARQPRRAALFEWIGQRVDLKALVSEWSSTATKLLPALLSGK